MANVRFQKRIRLLPFLWLNLSKTGTSLTLGCRFLKINVGKRGIWLTGSLTGTGLSVRHQLKKPNGDKPTPKQKAQSSGSTEKPKRKCVVSTPSSKRDPDMYSEFHQRQLMNDFMDDTPATSHNHDTGNSHHHSYDHCNHDSGSYGTCNNDNDY